MKKEEFPTFLNEQPKVIFGRTARELLMIVLGAASSYTLWQSISHLRPEGWWGPSCLVVCALLFISSIVLPMINIGTRPLEVWLAAWASYVLIPKVYIYQQLEEEAVTVEGQQGARDQKRDQQREESAIFEE